jgi:hypothetical protein
MRVVVDKEREKGGRNKACVHIVESAMTIQGSAVTSEPISTDR